jgi:hypothetical protein
MSLATQQICPEHTCPEARDANCQPCGPVSLVLKDGTKAEAGFVAGSESSSA